MSTPTSSTVTEATVLSFPVVGIGASAGGLEAVKALFRTMPDDSGMAFVLVMHLDPAYKSVLVELLEKYTTMPVESIADDMPLAPDHIYVLPPKRFVTLREGRLYLQEAPAARQAHYPVDYFFDSLARALHAQAVGIVLSGTLSDGSQGLRTIKQGGGLALAAAYAALLEKEPDEARELFKDLLIGVTGFFREPEVWQEMRRDVLPRLLGTREGGRPLRAWVVGCATGEEAYTLAMLLHETCAELKIAPNFQVFATNIDESALDVARKGLYPQNITGEVSAERLAQFFTHEDGTFQVKKELRDTIIFASQNIIADPPYSNLDLISCRNLLIYFQQPVQQKIIAL